MQGRNAADFNLLLHFGEVKRATAGPSTPLGMTPIKREDRLDRRPFAETLKLNANGWELRAGVYQRPQARVM